MIYIWKFLLFRGRHKVRKISYKILFYMYSKSYFHAMVAGCFAR